MSDQTVATLLRSTEPLVVIEASAGCGKTYQGAVYARDTVNTLGEGRLLILTHTHAACSVFAERTRSVGARVEIKTIDSLIAQIALAYQEPLGLPPNLTSWAWKNGGEGFQIMAKKVADFMELRPMIARALAIRYPIIICDEHQDSNVYQHSVVMSLFNGGAKLRVFGDPLQRIYKDAAEKEASARQRWNDLRESGASEKLVTPHRWREGCPLLGSWILGARESLENARPIDLTRGLPPSVKVICAKNIAQTRTGYQLSKDGRMPIDAQVRGSRPLMILAGQNDLVAALRAFFGRRIPIWEGHSREALASLVQVVQQNQGDAEALAGGLIDFMTNVAVRFSRSSHGNRLLEEVIGGASRSAKGKPANIQAVARCLLATPTHVGVAAALAKIKELVEAKASGFEGIEIDRNAEFKDAVRMGRFSDAEEAFAEMGRMRSYARALPPQTILSSLHKAKGLECDHVMIMACDKANFPETQYARCKLYVAISRARKSLTFVVSDTNPSPLLKTT